MTNTLADIERRVTLLLRKAEGTDNAHEAETFTAAAQKMMLRYGIEAARVRALAGEEAPSETIVQRDVCFTGRYAQALAALTFNATEGLGNLKAVRQDLRKGCISTIVGYESEVEHAVMLVRSLEIQALRDMWAWWRAYDGPARVSQHEGFIARRHFIMAFATRVRERLEAMRADAIAETDDTPGTELALRDRSAEVTSAYRAMFPKTRKGRNVRGNGDGQAAGRASGGRADLGGGKLDNATRQLCG